jgi:hypothetical protein
MPAEVGSKAIYLYCFASSALLSTVEEVGVDGKNPVFLLPCVDVVAVVSFVCAHEFSGHSAENGIGELAWVGPLACRHEAVVEQAMIHSPVLPMRFGTVFGSHKSLQVRLKEYHDRIKLFLHMVSGKDEWAVKAFLNPAEACGQFSKEIRAARSREIPLSPGALYLNERQIRALSKDAVNRSVEKICQSTGAELSRIASDLSVRKPLARAGIEDGKDMIVNWAFLVSRDMASDFCARVRRANELNAVPGLVFEISGPWPPYSFCPCLEGASRLSARCER